MRERERIKNRDNINKIINGVNITEARHERLKRILKDEFGVSWRNLTSKKRNFQIVAARRNYFYIMRYIFLYTLDDLGSLTNNHHATVIHNLKVHDLYMELYSEYKERYDRIKRMVLEAESEKEIKERIVFLEEQKSIIQRKVDELSIRKKRINQILTNK